MDERLDERELIASIMQIPEVRLSHIEIMDEDEELDLNEILRLADEHAVPAEHN